MRTPVSGASAGSWYTHTSSSEVGVAASPSSSWLSRTRHASGLSPRSSFPPGSSHSPRSFSRSATRRPPPRAGDAAVSTTPLTETGKRVVVISGASRRHRRRLTAEEPVHEEERQGGGHDEDRRER